MARGHLIDAAIAPLRWVERTRGWRRLALLAGYALIVWSVAVLVGREAVLWRIPDLPDPVPAVAGEPPEVRVDDPMTADFRRAAARLDRNPRYFEGLAAHDQSNWVWTFPDPGRLRPWLEANRPALDLWEAATRRPMPPRIGARSPEDTHRPEAPDPLYDDLLRLAKLATLDAWIRRDAGDSPGAWERYRAVLRMVVQVDRRSLSSVNGGWMGLFESRWSPLALGWADRPEVGPGPLRRALTDLNEIMALRPTEADLIRDQYCLLRNRFQRPEFLAFARAEWINNGQTANYLPGVAEAVAFWQNEPKRSLRVLRAVAAGQLARADQPPAQRPKLVHPEAYGIYPTDAATPPVLARHRPEAIVGWVESSYARYELSFPHASQWPTQTSWDRLDQTRLRIAERLFEVEHPDRTAATLGDLIPDYLDALPPGTTPTDPL